MRERLRVALERCSVLEEQLTASHKEVRTHTLAGFLYGTADHAHRHGWVNVCRWLVVAGVCEGAEQSEEDVYGRISRSESQL